jgi:hypothetical protein
MENLQKFGIWSFLSAYSWKKSPANGKLGPVPEEMSQTLLNNKKQGKIDKIHTTNIIKPAWFVCTRRNTSTSL